MDESQATPGSFEATGGLDTTFGLEVGSKDALNIVKVSASGEVGINKEVEIEYSNNEIKGEGEIGISSPTLTVNVEVDVGFYELEYTAGQHTFQVDAAKQFGPKVLHSFN